MQQELCFSDPTWFMTFPHRVMPLQDEWLSGLLLRCDEVNHWESRTTLTHVLHPGPEKFHRCWRTETPNLTVIQPSSLNLDSLAQFLALPVSALLATTYHTELARLYGESKLHPKLLNLSYSLRLCPQCLAEDRILKRTLTLPHITHCPAHLLTLQTQCQCGAPFRLFHRQALPFTCYTCGLDWSELPRVEVVPEVLVLEQNWLVWYEFFFSQGTYAIMREARRLMQLSWYEQFPLGDLVTLLVEHGYSPQDVLNSMKRVDLFSQLWMGRSSATVLPLDDKEENAL
ncbi:MAG: hypothetical protein E6J34_19645 [Chloroflexi bacterium]|nr:MAG: hypothetical protein E6J34_19645 [Chloroflexota bacterium]